MLSRVFRVLRRRKVMEELHEAGRVAGALSHASHLPQGLKITFVHKKWWRFGKRVRRDAKIPFRPVRSDTLQTVAQLIRAIQTEYRDYGYTAQVVGPDGQVPERTRLRLTK